MSNNENIPNHIAIIMDGNGRWAKKKNKFRVSGHKIGFKVLKNIVRYVNILEIKALTVFAFSSENWNRPEQEVSSLMSLFTYALKQEAKYLNEYNIRLNIIGDISKFSLKLQEMIIYTQELTKNNSGLALNIAVNYGGRWDITNACQEIAKKVIKNECSIHEIDEEMLNNQLSLNESPPIDLVIRTGGEFRISNFLLWQIAYSELYFTDILWPDFDEKALDDAISNFNMRERRFGRLLES